MVQPLPPSLKGPLYPQSKLVFVEPVLDGAVVTVLVDGQKTFEGPRPLDGWIEIGVGLNERQSVSARQTIGSEASLASINGVVVEPSPKQLPAPEFASVINNFSSLVAIRQLVIGARLEIFNVKTGELVAGVDVRRNFEYVRLKLDVNIQNAGTLSAVQSFGSVTSPRRTSPPLNDISSFVRNQSLLQPFAQDPLTACRTDLTLVGIPGLELSVANEGFVTNFLVAGFPMFAVTDCQPLKNGKLVVSQSVERLQLKRDSFEYVVGDPVAPRKPRILSPYCPTIQILTVVDLDPGADITVFAFNSGANNWLEIGRDKVGAWRKDLAIPAEMLLKAGIQVDQTLQLRVMQARCGVAGEASNSVGVGPYGAKHAPVIRGPVMDCSPFVILDATTLGSEVMLFDRDKLPLCAQPYHPVDGFNLLTLTRPVEAGETVNGSCRFCDGTLDIAVVTVAPIPERVSTNLGPIKPTDSFLHFTKCVVGSRIDIFRFDATTKSSNFITYTYPLEENWDVNVVHGAVLGDEFQFVVSICDAYVTKGAMRTQLGRLKVWLEPPSVKAATVVSVVYHVIDAAYGNPLSSDIYTEDGQVFSSIGNQVTVPWPVPDDRTAPYTGFARQPNYADEPYSLAVVKKDTPPPPELPRPPVTAELRLTSTGNIYKASCQLTVQGSGFPASTPMQLTIKFAEFKVNASSVSEGSEPLASFKAGENGSFTQTENFDLQLRNVYTDAVMNDGVTVVLVTGPTLYDSEYQEAVTLNTKRDLTQTRKPPL